MSITAKRLEEIGAGQGQIDAFRNLWGDGPASMTVDAAVENAETFDWDLFAQLFLTRRARAKYRGAATRAQTKYSREADAAVGVWMRTDDSEAGDVEYKRAEGVAWAEYNRAKARAFATLYIEQEDAA